jgi:hypothetical protein
MQRQLYHLVRLVVLVVPLLLSFLLGGCQPNITISTDPADTDLSAWHTEVVEGEGFAIVPDVRAFTVYAFLNGPAGWTDENGPAFSPARAQLVADMEVRLATVDPKQVKRWRSFYEQHRQIPYRYLYYTLALGAPPAFRHVVPLEKTKYPEIVGSLAGFNGILAEFYQAANIQVLYDESYRDIMLAEIRRYDPIRIRKQIAYVYDYLRLDRAQASAFDVVIVPVPFNSHWDAYALNYTDRLYIVEGPESNDYGLNVHEYLHMLMDDLIPGDLAGQRDKLNAIYEANRLGPYVQSYQELHTYVEENLVRALDHRMRLQMEADRATDMERTMADEVANGLVLVDDFYQGLEAYEQQPDQSARAFIAQLLQAVHE